MVQVRRPSVVKRVSRGLFLSFLSIVCFGFFFTLGIVPTKVRDVFEAGLTNNLKQTKWAIEKAVSYGDYHSVEDYFEKVIKIENIVSVYLRDTSGRCLAFASKKGSGCAYFNSQSSRYNLGSIRYISVVDSFFYEVIGRSSQKSTHAQIEVWTAPLKLENIS